MGRIGLPEGHRPMEHKLPLVVLYIFIIMMMEITILIMFMTTSEQVRAILIIRE